MTLVDPNHYLLDYNPNKNNPSAEWVHSTFAVSLGVDYATYADIISHSSQDEIFSKTPTQAAPDPTMQTVLSQIGDNQPTPVYYSKRKCRDTSLGGNDVINPYYQYNETDDVMHPFHYAEVLAPTSVTASSTPPAGMGRVYSETIDDHQQVMYLSFGIPVFNSLSNFYDKAASQNLADLMQKGPEFVSASSIGRLFGGIAGTLVELPVLSLMYIAALTNNFAGVNVTKYYDFKNQMPMYYKFVQTILVNLGVNMNLMDDGILLNNGKRGGTAQTTVTTVNSHSQNTATDNASSTSTGVPDYINNYQLDIYRILNKKFRYEQGANAIKDISTDQVVLAAANQSANSPDTPASGLVQWTANLFNSFTFALGASLTESQLFIGFKVEKGVSTSESLSNQTAPSEVSMQVNSKMQAARSTRFALAGGNIGFGVLGRIAEAAAGAAKDLASGVASGFGLGGLTALASGSGMIDIPEVWQDSSFSKSYSFKMQLRSPYGDPLSVIQSEYAPLACILAGALPRAIGNASYASPFLVRAYCKGMFAVPLGMIDSISIDRGGDIHGWTIGRLPTAIDVSFTIKDLSPAMYMAIGDQGGLFDETLGANSSFQEYMATLSGLGLYERVNERMNTIRKTRIYLQTVLKTRLNPAAWGMTLGNRPGLRLITSILPQTKYTPVSKQSFLPGN